MEADIHAAVLLASVVVTVAVALRFGSRKLNVPRICHAAILGLLGGFFVSMTVPYVTAGPGNNPHYQLLIPPLEAVVLWALIEKRWIRVLSFSAAIVLAIALGIHFYQLIGLGRNACRYTGDPRFMVNSCRQPAEAITLWHTPLTGLYEILIREAPPAKRL